MNTLIDLGWWMMPSDASEWAAVVLLVVFAIFVWVLSRKGNR